MSYLSVFTWAALFDSLNSLTFNLNKNIFTKEACLFTYWTKKKKKHNKKPSRCFKSQIKPSLKDYR